MLLLLALLATASSSRDPDHAAVRDVVVAAMNNFPDAPAQFLGLLEEDAAWCDPYPSCQHGTKNISTFLNSMPPGTNTVLLAESLVTVGLVGGMMTTVSFSWPGQASSCLYTADQHVSWKLSSNGSDGAGKLKLDYLRWVYNASEFDAAIGSCLAGAAPPATLRQGRARRDRAAPARDAELQAVHDYVVGLQYSLPQQALICDLLVPTARYCDPYPESCAFGRTGCRAMKGLPNDTSTLVATTEAAVVEDEGAGLAGPKVGSQASYQCRPGSVRPLLATGAETGALYMVYSSVSRNGSKLSHKAHHTYAIWDLAPASTEQTGPAPMLASFDWFMPHQNL